MAPKHRWLPPVLLPLAVLAAACAVVLALPFRMIEPDDDDYFYGMHAFSTGKVVLTRAEAEKLASIPLADPAKRRPQMVRGIGTSRGFIRERSPGHYALLALFHRAGLDRYANVVLAFIAVGFFYYVVRRHTGEGAEGAASRPRAEAATVREQERAFEAQCHRGIRRLRRTGAAREDPPAPG